MSNKEGKEVQLLFGLEAQGHIETIESFIQDNKYDYWNDRNFDKWRDLAKVIGWCPVTANNHYIEYLQKKKAKVEAERDAYKEKLGEPIEIELGHGDKLVSDIYDDKNGEWSGIAISDGNTPVGEFSDEVFNSVADLNAHLIIRTKNPKSLDVIIAACERAKLKILDN